MVVYTPDSARVIHPTSVDLITRSIGDPIHLVQYDNKLPIIAVEVYQNGQPYKLPDTAEASIRLSKPDKTYVCNPALGTNTDRTIIYFEITYQMTVYGGEFHPIIELTIGDHVGGSSSVAITVDDNPIQNGMIESTIEFKLLIQYCSEAKTAASSAKTSEINAKASETNAKKSENNAALSASSSRSASDSSIAAANASESSALESGKSASSSAESASASSASATNASKSASAAKTSETNAAASASAAKTSETNANTYKTNAAASASAAKTSEDNSAESALAASNSASASSASATNASKSASAAKTSETNAAASVSAAKTSEINAKASENDVNTLIGNIRQDLSDHVFDGAMGPQGAAGPQGPIGLTGTRGSRWTAGTAITGTSTTATVYSGTGITDALINDMYLNTSTGLTYKCTTGGNASTAKWVYAGSIKGTKGDKGDTGSTGATGPQGPTGPTGPAPDTSNFVQATNYWDHSNVTADLSKIMDEIRSVDGKLPTKTYLINTWADYFTGSDTNKVKCPALNDMFIVTVYRNHEIGSFVQRWLSRDNGTSYLCTRSGDTWGSFMKEAHNGDMDSHNMVINGSFSIWQRGTEFDGVKNQINYTADRFAVYRAGTDPNLSVYKIDNSWSKHGMQIVSRTAGVWTTVEQSFDYQDCVNMRSKNVTFSLTAALGHTEVVTNGVSISISWNTTNGEIKPGSGGQYTKSKLIAPEINEKTFEVTAYIPQDVTGVSVSMTFTGKTTNDIINTFNWKLEVGTVSTPFSPKTYAQELLDCQRFYYSPGYAGYQKWAPCHFIYGFGVVAPVHPPVAMRVSPTAVRSTDGVTQVYSMTGNWLPATEIATMVSGNETLLIITVANVSNLLSEGYSYLATWLPNLDAEIH